METIKTLRKAKGLTQKELGSLVGCSESTICMYESGRRSPDYETLMRIANVFNCSIDKLLNNEKPLVNDDEELTEVLEKMRDRPEMRMLFSITKDATADDVMRAVKIIEALKNNEG